MITSKAWREYIDAHNRIQSVARDELLKFYDSLPWVDNRNLALAMLVEKAKEVAEMYGLADSTLSAGFYDELMLSYGEYLPPADVALPIPQSVAKDVAAAVEKATSMEAARSLVGGEMTRHVKIAGIKTMRNAAARDGAMWAWVCIGDSCSFCRVLGSNGFQPASKAIENGRHAEHVHGNCDCQFVVKPKGASLDIEGYDPAALAREYSHASDGGSRDKINAMRRADYTPAYAEQRNARRRELYAAARQEQADDND